MDERILREALAERDGGAGPEDCAGQATFAGRAAFARQATFARLQPEIDRAAERLRRRREARRQNSLFLGCALAFMLAAAFALRDWSQGGMAFKGFLMGGGALMGLTLALSPLMAYWLEREREHENA